MAALIRVAMVMGTFDPHSRWGCRLVKWCVCCIQLAHGPKTTHTALETGLQYTARRRGTCVHQAGQKRLLIAVWCRTVRDSTMGSCRSAGCGPLIDWGCLDGLANLLEYVRAASLTSNVRSSACSCSARSSWTAEGKGPISM